MERRRHFVLDDDDLNGISGDEAGEVGELVRDGLVRCANGEFHALFGDDVKQSSCLFQHL